MAKVCKLIGDMIHVEPEKRISLEHVVKDLEIIYPSDTNSNQRSSFNKVWLMIPNQYESSTNIKSQYNLDSK
jgi:hypothetical protein